MDFKEAYLTAMQEQAPETYRYLRKTGALEAHLNKKTQEAYSLLDQLTADEPKLPNGVVRDPQALASAERTVMQQLIEFPEGPSPA